MPTPEDAAKLAIVRRFIEVGNDYQAHLDRLKGIEAAKATEEEIASSIQARANDCYAAARVLDFDLIAELTAYHARQSAAALDELLAAPSTVATMPQATAQIITKQKPIKDEIIDLARAAYPEPVRAAALQAELEKTRGQLHYKTVGMSLYRLSREGVMQRKGQKDWFFVPDNERTKKPGVVPGSPEELDL